MDLTADDYVGMLRALLPRGAIWQAKPGSFQEGVLKGFAQEFARIDARVADLLAESLPETTNELLTEWEAEFGLPESCDTRTGLTDDERRTRLAAKVHYRAIRGAQRWHTLAASYGATVELYSYYPSCAGRARAGTGLVGRRGRYFWRALILTPTVTVTRAAAGRTRAGQSLATWPRSPLECAIRKRNPAHMIVFVGYTED